MVRLAAWLVNDVALAEEIVQDAFVRIATSSRSLATVDSSTAYLRTTVVNVARTRIRRLALARRHQPKPSNPAPSAEDLLADDELAAAVASLPRRQRECVALRYTDDLTINDIADTLGISPGAVKSHLHRALTTLASVLEGSTAAVGQEAP